MPSFRRKASRKAGIATSVAWVYSTRELDELLETAPRIRFCRAMSLCVKHLKTSYRRAKGAEELGYTPIRPVMRVDMSSTNGRPSIELMVECEEGLISRDEAIGGLGIPDEKTIWERAAAIRAANDAAGVQRNGEFYGFDLQQVYEPVMLELA